MAAHTRLTLEGLAGGVTNYVSCLEKSACTPSQLGGQCCLPGKGYLHSFLAGGLTLAAWERVPALLPGQGDQQVESPTMFPAWEECLHCFPARWLLLHAWERVPAFLPGQGDQQVESPTMFPAWERVPALLPCQGVSTACLGKSACTASQLGGYHCLPGKEYLHSFLAGGLTLAAWERVPALLPGQGDQQVESPTMFPVWGRVPALLPCQGVSTACLGKSACTASQLGGQHCLPGKEYLHFFLAGGLTLAARKRVPALLPGQGDQQVESQLCFLPGKECLHCFPARGLALPALERVPALLPNQGVSTACLGKSTCIPSWLGD